MSDLQWHLLIIFTYNAIYIHKIVNQAFLSLNVGSPTSTLTVLLHVSIVSVDLLKHMLAHI